MDIAETAGHELPVYFVEKGFRVEGVGVAGTAVDEEGDNAFRDAAVGAVI